MKKILNRNNQTSNNTAVIIVIFVTTIVLVFLVAVLMFLMLDRKRTADGGTVVSESSTEETEKTDEVTEDEGGKTDKVTDEISDTTIQEPVFVPSNSQVSDDTVKYTMYVVNCNSWISLRKSPSTSATRLKEIPLGASCSFIEEASNGFYKVIYNGTTGYALAQYLTTDKSAVATSSAPATSYESSQGTLYVVNCDEWISLRSSASTSASRLAKIPLGASCEYLSSASNGFYKVRYNGTTGYALSQYLSSQKSYSSDSAPTTTTLCVVNCDEWISLRSSASTSASRLAKIPLGATCEYLSSASNGFYKVRYNGTTGYALSQYLSSTGCGH